MGNVFLPLEIYKYHNVKKKKKNHNVFIASYYKNICEKKNTNGPLFKQLFLKPDN